MSSGIKPQALWLQVGIQTEATLRSSVVSISGLHSRLGSFIPKKDLHCARGRCPLMGCCTSLELGQSKSLLKCVQGGCQICSTKGFPLQTCSHLSSAFANVNMTSDATSTPSWQVPIPFLSPEFLCPEKTAEQIWRTQFCRRPDQHKKEQANF